MSLAHFHALPIDLAQLSLEAVLRCGQSFRWKIFELQNDGSLDPARPTHEYRLALSDRVICLRQSPDTLFFRAQFPPNVPPTPAQHSETIGWLQDYLQLDVDLVKLYDEWSVDPVFNNFKSRFVGIRILRQDPWENLFSFICSSNNHISRISKMVTSACTHFSPPLLSMSAPGDESGALEPYHAFPPPSAFAQPSASGVLRNLGFGYRAEFIQRTAKMLVDAHPPSSTGPIEWLKTLRKLPTTEAREELLKFVGVGRKVADCVLLMSMDKVEVIPVDTHVHQIAIKHYGLRGKVGGAKVNMTGKIYDEVCEKLSLVWGPYAGWAHSVLFTADLKSFSSYGLLSPAPATPATPKAKKEKISAVKTEEDTLPVFLPPSPAPSPEKCKREREEEVDLKLEADVEVGVSMADRVKRRRRAVNHAPP